jgi:hypothetical protein
METLIFGKDEPNASFCAGSVGQSKGLKEEDSEALFGVF